METTPDEKGPEQSYASNAWLADAVASAAPDAPTAAEVMTSTGSLRRRSNFEPGQFFNTRGGGLGYGLPASVGTAIVKGERDESRDVIGFIADGAHLFYPNTLYTAVRHDVDLTVIVADNRNYCILKDNMMSRFGGEEEDYDFVGMDFEPPINITANAKPIEHLVDLFTIPRISKALSRKPSLSRDRRFSTFSFTTEIPHNRNLNQHSRWVTDTDISRTLVKRRIHYLVHIMSLFD